MDEITMFAELRPSDAMTDAEVADIRAELFPHLEPQPDASPAAARHEEVDLTVRTLPIGDADSQRARRRSRTVASAAAAVAVLGIGGLWVAANRDDGATPAPAAQPAGATTAPDVQRPPDVLGPTTTMVPEPTCADGDQTEVPNVAGMAYPAAAHTLLASGLSFEVMRETPPEGETTTDDTYTVVDQDTTPGDIVACGAEVRITAAWRPGKLHTVEPGDTWDSIAAAQGIPVEDLLGFNGFTVAELETAEESITSPLEVGRAISLTPNTVPTPTG